MSQKQRNANEMTQIQADDFTLINGITQTIARRLYAADIETYSQLASLTPKEILEKLGKGKGYSIKRIKEENWIGQAQGLIPKKAQPKPSKKEMAKPTLRQHYENFTIELLLDEKNIARRSHIVHVQSGDADTWAGWETERLFDFVGRHTGVYLPLKSANPKPLKRSLPTPTSSLKKKAPQDIPETVSAFPVETSRHPEPAPTLFGTQSKTQSLASANALSLEAGPHTSSSTHDAANSIMLLKWMISLPGTDQSLRSLPHDEIFDVCLTLDLSKASLSTTAQLDCSVTVHAKKLGGGSRKLIGQVQETTSYKSPISLPIRCITLSPGIYRLEGFVTIQPAVRDANHPTKLMTFLEFGPIQVY